MRLSPINLVGHAEQYKKCVQYDFKFISVYSDANSSKCTYINFPFPILVFTIWKLRMAYLTESDIFLAAFHPCSLTFTLHYPHPPPFLSPHPHFIPLIFPSILLYSPSPLVSPHEGNISNMKIQRSYFSFSPPARKHFL